MELANLGDATLEFETAGVGEPVVFIHGSFIANAFGPLLGEPTIASRYHLINYHRRGYVGSSRPERVLSISEQAADCHALLRHLGVAHAHVVGHSFGGAVALQLALDAPELVRSLALLEPALAVGESGQGYREALATAIQRYHQVGAIVIVNEFLEARWPRYRAPLARMVPGAFDQAVADAPNTFELELPGLLEWRFTEDEARRIGQPVLSVLGGKSEVLWPRFGETHRTLLAWFQNAEECIVPDTTHFMQLEKPRTMADALAAFYERHLMDGLVTGPGRKGSLKA